MTQLSPVVLSVLVPILMVGMTVLVTMMARVGMTVLVTMGLIL